MSGFAGHPRLEVKKGKPFQDLDWCYCSTDVCHMVILFERNDGFYIPVKLPFQKSLFRGWSIPIEFLSTMHVVAHICS